MQGLALYNTQDVLTEIQLPLSYEEVGEFLDTQDKKEINAFLRDYDIKTQTANGVTMINLTSFGNAMQEIGAESIEELQTIVREGVLEEYAELYQ